MTPANIRVWPLEHVGDPNRIEPLARAVFGEGQRPTGWFARKLARECVRASRSAILTRSTDPTDEAAWIGYGLLGRPASLGDIARTAGIGVREPWRGQGHGRRLVQWLLASAAADGATGVVIPASTDAEPFYSRCGLRRAETTHTVLAFGHGRACRGVPEAWDAPTPGPLRSGWFREAWEHTERRATQRLRNGADRFDVSFEGTAHVAMRWTSSDGSAHGPAAWLHHVPAGVPALLHEVPSSAPYLGGLLERDWTVVQTTIAMRTAWGNSTLG